MSDTIRLINICKSFDGKEVLNNYSAVITKGQITALTAPSGSGKTTLLRIMTGLETMDSGRIEGMENMKVSVVFQEDRLCDNLDAISNIKLVNTKNSCEEIAKALTAVGLSDCINQKVSELSGGMKRRVALLRGLLADYDILFLDEPFRGLDEQTKLTVIKDTLERIEGKTVLLITHDAEEINIMNINNRIFL